MESEADIVNGVTQNFKDQFHTPIPEEAREPAKSNSPPPKKSGGQPGNRNARKHGFYSRRLSPQEQADLEEAKGMDLLDEEMAVLRVKIGTLVENPNVDLKLLLSAFQTLGRMLRTDDRVRFGS